MVTLAVETLVPRSVLTAIAAREGLPDRYRLPFVALLVVFGFGGLALLAYKLRSADPDQTGERPPDSTFDRDGILERAGTNGRIDRLLQVANRPSTYAVMLGTMLATGILELIFGWFGSGVLGVVFFAGLLLSTKAFLRFGWPVIESFHDRRQPNERNPDSLRFQGFSTDMLILMTLVVLMFVGMLTLVVLESRVL